MNLTHTHAEVFFVFGGIREKGHLWRELHIYKARELNEVREWAVLNASKRRVNVVLKTMRFKFLTAQMLVLRVQLVQLVLLVVVRELQDQQVQRVQQE